MRGRRTSVLGTDLRISVFSTDGLLFLQGSQDDTGSCDDAGAAKNAEVTAREAEGLALIARHLTNAQIRRNEPSNWPSGPVTPWCTVPPWTAGRVYLARHDAAAALPVVRWRHQYVLTADLAEQVSCANEAELWASQAPLSCARDLGALPLRLRHSAECCHC